MTSVSPGSVSLPAAIVTFVCNISSTCVDSGSLPVFTWGSCPGSLPQTIFSSICPSHTSGREPGSMWADRRRLVIRQDSEWPTEASLPFAPHWFPALLTPRQSHAFCPELLFISAHFGFSSGSMPAFPVRRLSFSLRFLTCEMEITPAPTSPGCNRDELRSFVQTV